jgi:hypothetical protein
VSALGARTVSLERALMVTRSLCERVEQGDWGAAAGLEAERRQLLEDFFAARPPAEELGHVVALLKDLIAANDSLIGMADHHQRLLAREAETIAIGRVAVRAYGRQSP